MALCCTGGTARLCGRAARGQARFCLLLAIVAVVCSLRASFMAFTGGLQVLRHRALASRLIAHATAEDEDWRSLLKEEPKPRAKEPGFGGPGTRRKQKKRVSLEDALKRQKEAELASEKDRREDAKLAPEEFFYEGPPAATEILGPFLASFAVLGIIPLIAAVNRQFRVKYTITSRRVSVASGWDGNDVTEFSFAEIKEVKYASRAFGYCADVRIDLRDGAAVELFNLADFEENYWYIWDRMTEDAKERSMRPPPKSD